MARKEDKNFIALLRLAVKLISLPFTLYQSNKRISTSSRKSNSGGTTTRKNNEIVIPGQIHHWEPTNYYELEIVGEANYQTALKKIAGKHGDIASTTEFIAILIPEDTNPYDDKAIRVDIGGMTVGYLNREDARDFRIRLDENKLTGQPTTCRAMIKGGFMMENGRRAHYGVSLAIENIFDK